MAVVARGDRRLTLGARSLVGRATDCVVVLDSRKVSSEHAAITWAAERWSIRDLGSRNGTFVNGERLVPGAKVALAAGARLGFAEEEWTLLDAAAPLARARRGAEVSEQDAEGVLFVGAPGAGVVIVPDGEAWLLLGAGDAGRPVTDHEELEVAGATYTLELPPRTGDTTETTEHSGNVKLDAVTLRFRVSQDAEHVAVELRTPQLGAVKLPSRAHHHVLLALARVREHEHRSGVAPGEAGWVYTDALQDELDMDRTRLNLELHRARQLLARHGIADPEAIIERRTDTQQLRLGVARIEIVKA